MLNGYGSPSDSIREVYDVERPLENIEETRRQAEIRELYSKLGNLESRVANQTALVEETPTVAGITLPIVNYLDNSDFDISHYAYSDTTDTTFEKVLSKWYSKPSSASATGPYYINTSTDLSKYGILSELPSGQDEPDTWDKVVWDQNFGVIRMTGGYSLASPLFARFASQGNTFYFRAQITQVSFSLDITQFTNDGKFYVSASSQGYAGLKNGIRVKFVVLVDPANSKIPSGVSVDKLYIVSGLTVPGTGDPYFNLKETSDGPIITGIGDWTYVPTVPKCIMVSRINPDVTMRVSIWENNASGTDSGIQPYEIDEGDGPKSRVILSSILRDLTEFNTKEVVASIKIPDVIDADINRGEQWLQIEFLKPDLTATNDVDIPLRTLMVDKIGLSPTYGIWHKSSRDVSLVRKSLVTPTSPIPIGGGRGGDTTGIGGGIAPNTGGGGSEGGGITRQYDPTETGDWWGDFSP